MPTTLVAADEPAVNAVRRSRGGDVPGSPWRVHGGFTFADDRGPMPCDHDDVPKRVLVVDDEPKITQVVADYLRTAGFTVTTAANGTIAISAARAEPPDLVVLDLGLPGMDGLDVARELRRGSAMPIIMLTARGAEADRVVGLELGADDYIVKPFSPRELLARIRAVLRRVDGAAVGSERFAIGDVAIDTARREVTVLGRRVDLTATEFDLLVPLARQPGRVFTRGQLLDALHGVVVESYERTVDAHVKNIRRKLEPHPHEPRYLLTVHGVGYRFAEGERRGW
jgi:DNA-binding response OmpR family regulator